MPEFSIRRFHLVVILVCVCFGLGAVITQAQGTSADPGSQVEYTVEQYKPANYPVAMAFTADGRLFYTEKATGIVRVIPAGDSGPSQPVITFPVDSLVERGLLGIALDPNYNENGYIWVVATHPGDAQNYPANQIIRFREENNVGSEPLVMLTEPIKTGELKHNGGNVHFDSDGLLYVSFGELGDEANSQDLNTIPGKIHRFQVVEDHLEAAPGNPFPNSSIYAYGLRNPFDFAFDPFSGGLFAAENGFKCDDEIDLILPGKNYGWGPDYGEQCFGMNPVDVPDYQAPLVSFTPTIGMAGITFYGDGAAFPEWAGNIFFCNWNAGAMQRAVLDEARTAITAVYPVDLQGFFCRIDVTVGPEGGLYFADPGGIYRIVPK
ncbi:MAG: PQQ-dependent sugar dehydrogenase [Anaerolineae bacterium]